MAGTYIGTTHVDSGHGHGRRAPIGKSGYRANLVDATRRRERRARLPSYYKRPLSRLEATRPAVVTEAA